MRPDIFQISMRMSRRRPSACRRSSATPEASVRASMRSTNSRTAAASRGRRCNSHSVNRCDTVNCLSAKRRNISRSSSTSSAAMISTAMVARRRLFKSGRDTCHRLAGNRDAISRGILRSRERLMSRSNGSSSRSLTTTESSARAGGWRSTISMMSGICPCAISTSKAL